MPSRETIREGGVLDVRVLFNENGLSVRHMTADDYPQMAAWLSDPRVLEFYEGRDRPHDLPRVQQVFGRKLDGAVTACIVFAGEQDIGYIQFYLLAHDEKLAYGFDVAQIVYGLDQFIGEPELWNRGIGTTLMQAMMRYLSRKFRVSFVVMDPQAWNTRAIRCYEKAGFRKARRLPKHERHEGELRDCWLMVWTPEEVESNPARSGSWGTESNLTESGSGLLLRLVKLDPRQMGESALDILSSAVFQPTEERMNHILSEVYGSDSTTLYGLAIGPDLVAVAGIRRTSETAAELLHIAVKASERRKGIGCQLVKLVIQAENLEELVAETDRDAVNFYRRCGFTAWSLGEKYPGVERFACRWSAPENLPQNLS